MKNKKIILVLSGEIGTGKSTVAESLKNHFEFKILSTRDAIIKLAIKKFGQEKIAKDRKLLQLYGEKLDKETKGEWVKNFFQNEINGSDYVIIESVRKQEQIDALRKAYGHYIVHVHLYANPDTLKERFLEREMSKDSTLKQNVLLKKYKEYKSNETEKQVNILKDKADIIVSTDKKVAKDVFIRVASFLNLLGPINKPLVDVIIGAQYGSEGKGQIVGYLAPEYDCLVRVGGPNAGHQVYNETNGVSKPDVFHVIPSGSRRNPNSKIIIGPGAVISTEVILDEITKFGIDDPSRLIIDPNATIISKEDIRIEAKLNKIGGTGQGVGAATANNILERLKSKKRFKAVNERKLKQYIKSSHEELEKIFRVGKNVLLEGTQGTFLSLHHGSYPYVTSRDTTVAGCLAEAGIGINRVRKIILVTRTYPIRVQNPIDGNSGPFINKEIEWSEIAKRSGIELKELKNKERTSTTDRERRVAEFSWYELRKSCELNTPTDIALTFADYIHISNRNARRYDQLTPATTQFIEEIERCSGIPASLISTRFAFRSIIDRRNWV
ncbi:MAG: adenylosuccinate synthetase [Saprospiraceae bacterium]|jgi:adenylosuccinate synthase